MRKIYYSKEEIEKVREMDLFTYLKLYEPENLVHIHGNVYCTRQHDSLKISNGKWMWWSRGFGGASALDYLIKVTGLPFLEAMERLSGKKESEPSFFVPSNIKIESKKLLLPEKNDSCRHIKKYLIGRKIAENIIDNLIERGLLYESKPYHSCIFLGRDDNKIPRYAAFRCCSEEKILGEAAGSDKSYPFRIEAPGSPVLHLFESAIDLLSFATIKQRRGSKWNEDNLLSMGGIGVSKCGTIPVAIGRFLKDNPHIKEIQVHFDNDLPGKNAAAALKKVLEKEYSAIISPPPQGEDYNDYLNKLIKKT